MDGASSLLHYSTLRDFDDMEIKILSPLILVIQAQFSQSHPHSSECVRKVNSEEIYGTVQM